MTTTVFGKNRIMAGLQRSSSCRHDRLVQYSTVKSSLQLLLRDINICCAATAARPVGGVQSADRPDFAAPDRASRPGRDDSAP